MKLQMIIKLSIFLSFTVLNISTINLSHTEIKYDSSPEDIRRTIEFNQNYTEMVTEGRISFDYNEKLGTYCTARKPLKKADLAIKVPINFTMCSYDIFPFMFELKDIIYSHLSKKIGNNVNDTNSKTIKYLSALKFLYHKNADQEKVEEYLRKNGKEYYINRLNDQNKAYLDSLPKIQFNEPMLDKDDRFLAELIGFPVANTDEYQEIIDLLVRHYSYTPLKVFSLNNSGLHCSLG